MLKRCHLIIFTILLMLFYTSTTAMASSGWIIYYESGFKGKVIDAETKGPIEGAVVVAIYEVWILGLGHSGSDYADVQETLTDSNGEYYLPGNFFFHPWPFSRSTRTNFIVFKPGHESYPRNYSFLIYPTSRHVQKDEGIVFKKNIKDREERDIYKKKFKYGWSPFIPLKDPVEKVKNLDIPFDTDIMNAEAAWSYKDMEPFKTYPLIGLSKAKTMEERNKSHTGAGSIPDGFENKLPKLKKLLKEEYNFITKGGR